MIKQTLRFRATGGPATEPNSFLNSPVNQVFFWSFCVDLLKRLFCYRAVNLLHCQISFQPPAACRSLFHSQRCKADGEMFIVKVAVLPQPRNNSFHYLVVGSATFEQSFA